MKSGAYSPSEPLFYCPNLANTAGTANLDEAEARHARGSRRLAVRDIIWLFDGHGIVGRATINAINRQTRALEATIHKRHIVPVPRPNVELACALPKGERQAVLLVDMTTQLGMRAFTPLVCERSVVRAGPDAKQRWRKIYIEACKQSRGAYLPTIYDPVPPAKVVTQASEADYAVWAAHPNGTPLPTRDLGKGPVWLPDPLLLMVGPEDGFTGLERSQIVAAGGKQLVWAQRYCASTLRR